MPPPPPPPGPSRIPNSYPTKTAAVQGRKSMRSRLRGGRWYSRDEAKGPSKKGRVGDFGREIISLARERNATEIGRVTFDAWENEIRRRGNDRRSEIRRIHRQHRKWIPGWRKCWEAPRRWKLLPSKRRRGEWRIWRRALQVQIDSQARLKRHGHQCLGLGGERSGKESTMYLFNKCDPQMSHS